MTQDLHPVQPPPGAQLSPDGRYWWDGSAWKPAGAETIGNTTEAAALPSQSVKPTVLMKHSQGALAVEGSQLVMRTGQGAEVERADLAAVTQLDANRRDWVSPLTISIKYAPGGQWEMGNCKPPDQARALVDAVRAVGAQVSVNKYALKGFMGRWATGAGEQMRQEGRYARPEPTIQVKTYSGAKEYEKDAPRMVGAGWQMEGQSGTQGKVNMGRSLVKAGVFLPWAIMRPSRKGDKLTITWVKTPKATADQQSVVEAAPLAAPAIEDIPAKIKQLADLRDSGLINAEEYEAKRADLLGRF
jgi:hypothetical protein